MDPGAGGGVPRDPPGLHVLRSGPRAPGPGQEVIIALDAVTSLQPGGGSALASPQLVPRIKTLVNCVVSITSTYV